MGCCMIRKRSAAAFAWVALEFGWKSPQHQDRTTTSYLRTESYRATDESMRLENIRHKKVEFKYKKFKFLCKCQVHADYSGGKPKFECSCDGACD